MGGSKIKPVLVINQTDESHWRTPGTLSNLLHEELRKSIAWIALKTFGVEYIEELALDWLASYLTEYLRTLGRQTRLLASNAGRNMCNAVDFLNALHVCDWLRYSQLELGSTSFLQQLSTKGSANPWWCAPCKADDAEHPESRTAFQALLAVHLPSPFGADATKPLNGRDIHGLLGDVPHGVPLLVGVADSFVNDTDKRQVKVVRAKCSPEIESLRRVLVRSPLFVSEAPTYLQESVSCMKRALEETGRLRSGAPPPLLADAERLLTLDNTRSNSVNQAAKMFRDFKTLVTTVQVEDTDFDTRKVLGPLSEGIGLPGPPLREGAVRWLEGKPPMCNETGLFGDLATDKRHLVHMPSHLQSWMPQVPPQTQEDLPQEDSLGSRSEDVEGVSAVGVLRRALEAQRLKDASAFGRWETSDASKWLQLFKPPGEPETAKTGPTPASWELQLHLGNLSDEALSVAVPSLEPEVDELADADAMG